LLVSSWIAGQFESDSSPSHQPHVAGKDVIYLSPSLKISHRPHLARQTSLPYFQAKRTFKLTFGQKRQVLDPGISLQVPDVIFLFFCNPAVWDGMSALSKHSAMAAHSRQCRQIPTPQDRPGKTTCFHWTCCQMQGRCRDEHNSVSFSCLDTTVQSFQETLCQMHLSTSNNEDAATMLTSNHIIFHTALHIPKPPTSTNRGGVYVNTKLCPDRQTQHAS
jgi:hypothetical protein